jgi:hypothetical protein
MAEYIVYVIVLCPKFTDIIIFNRIYENPLLVL